MRLIITFTLLIFSSLSSTLHGQNNSFAFGQIAYEDLMMKIYTKDTTAEAVILKEFGEAYVDQGGDHNLLFEKHYVLKILTQEGVSRGNIEIPLYKNNSRKEILRELKVSSFNMENNRITESTVDTRRPYIENRYEFLDVVKIAVPNIVPGTIIEVSYKLESPFFTRNFRGWNFQADIPKRESEYWATITGNYQYYIGLRGFLKLAKNENRLIKECFNIGGGYKADCVRYKFSMKDVPSFKEEDYMTAPSNFIASIFFELMEVRHFNGSVDKVTTTWKEADNEMRKDPKFGQQLKKGKDIAKAIEPILSESKSPMDRAKKVYEFIKNWYQWNETYGKYSELGIKKAFDTRTGNVGDINLSLIAALDYAGLNVEPLALSTRSNGLPTDIFPVLSDFNYVVAKLNIDDQVILLDATDPLLPFGLLPERCLNGRGRVFGSEESYWHDIVAPAKRKITNSLKLNLESDGTFKGSIETHYFGYEAFSQRNKIKKSTTVDAYVKDHDEKMRVYDILSYEILGIDNLEDPIIEKFSITIDGFDDLNTGTLFLNPFFIKQFNKNPFTLNERLYPVDFGVPLEITSLLALTMPAEFEVNELPQSIALSLPNNGGKFIFSITALGDQISMSYTLQFAKPVYSSQEYYYLRELINRVIQTESSNIVFKKK